MFRHRHQPQCQSREGCAEITPGIKPTWPLTYSVEPACTAWLYAPTAAGASSVLMSCFDEPVHRAQEISNVDD